MRRCFAFVLAQIAHVASSYVPVVQGPQVLACVCVALGQVVREHYCRCFVAVFATLFAHARGIEMGLAF